MTLYAFDERTIPAETARVAQAAFPKGNIYIWMRDELGNLYRDSEFADLFPTTGQGAISPGLLALVTVMQFAEGLGDRQAAEAVRARIDWKYALNLELTDPGFDHTVLSEFRTRLLSGGAAERLLEHMLAVFKAKGWVKSRGKQRTDATHVLGAVWQLSRQECVGETLRQVLERLAEVEPEWLVSQISPEWFERYGRRVEAARPPSKPAEQAAWQQQVGQDGWQLLRAIYGPTVPPELRALAEVELMRQVWIQQYYYEDDQVKWREKDNLPPHHLMILSPYEPEVRFKTKGARQWVGYSMHLTETCDEDSPNVIVNVLTTPATTPEGKGLAPIHTRLAAKELLPADHLVDSGYVDSGNLISSQDNHQVDLIGPIPANPSWQTQAHQGFEVSCFVIDWVGQKVTCPQGHPSQHWAAVVDQRGNPAIQVRFRPADCHACPVQWHCTRSKRGVRELQLLPQAKHEAVQAARHRQQTDAFKQKYNRRAGIEGTISQATGAFDLRHSRYRGLAKTHFQGVVTAIGINLNRVWAWLNGVPKAPTRKSKFLALAPIT